MFRSGRYSNLHIPSQFPIKEKFMPWPHKNSDGVIPKSEKAPSLALDMGLSKTVEQLDAMMKQVFGGTQIPVVEHKDLWAYYHSPTTIYPPNKNQLAAMSAIEKEKVISDLKKYGIVPPNFTYKEDPILIPATEKKQSLWQEYQSLPPVSKQITAIHQTIYTTMPGLPKDKQKVGASWALDPTHNYTEAEIRQKLQHSFKQMEDLIINSLKENKK